MAITGGDIPAELFGIILTFLRSPVLTLSRKGRRGVAAEKSELGAISLVSRYWAKMCRPRIFTNITLRCADDIYTLLSFIRSPLSCIAEYIVIVTIPPLPSSGIPWIHLLPLLWPNLRYKEWALAVRVDGPAAARQSNMRSVHRVPRPVPSFSQYIDALTLRKVKFRRFGDLVALVEEFRQLNKLHCEELTWPEETTTPKLPQRRAHALFTAASMTDCTSDWRAMWFTAGFSAVADPCWPESDWDAFLPLLRSLESGLPPKCANRKLRVVDRGTCTS